MTEFRNIFAGNEKGLIHKWDHYFDIYERHFQKFKNKPITLLEIGVSKGGSLEMWRQYFGESCTIIGIDINPSCKQFETEKTKIFIGDQGDRDFLNNLKNTIPKPDIIIDDGSHLMHHQRIAFEELYLWMNENGVYLVEDLHTSYWYDYEGGYQRKNTFIEYCKTLVDQLNAWHSKQRKFQVNELTRSTGSIHFYDSVVVFEKRPVLMPTDVYSGKQDHAEIIHLPPKIDGWFRNFKNKLYWHLGIDL